MLYDLNLAWSPATTADRLLQTLSLAHSLGYATVALNHTLEAPYPANPTSPFPPRPEASPSGSKLPHVLHRATLPVSDPAASSYRLHALANVYDIIAVRPLTEQAFQNACLTLDVPIISLDLTTQFPFHFRPKPCMAAVSRGVRFEICYGQLLAADGRGRANFIGNVTNLFRTTRGRGFIISSEAKAAIGLRGPADVVNMLSVWGLTNEKGIEGFRSTPRSVVVNEGIKRNGFRGVVRIVQTATREESGAAAGASTEVSQASQNTSTTKVAQSHKRKKGENDGGQLLSKPRAKKTKLAAAPVADT
ncbi:ribonuclease P complex subunit Pop2 [Drechmeria coniospora]|uniref:Ribonuclease P complex subunit Pop2 n=1 Tax=Drechmeria coniospora TaxID=98403 RepID=A0A151GBV1_DRECN|nr:ribonuclease P complex subunit Pop2 [Drechmeria coniospora]KYK54596.1 ribonuclease P complex subunit Pop2 [Drechmeria coniospora]ODA80478.1 hypothetical protein RJ55_03436 [Drechmeria coniospora]